MMRLPRSLALLSVLCASCDQLPGKPAPRAKPIDVTTVAGFQSYYATNCSGCHGVNGAQGPARPLTDASYLASVPADAMLAMLRDGIPNTRMPGFGTHSIGGVEALGGTTDAQLQAFITTMNSQWGASNAVASTIPWKHTAGLGDASRGASTFATHCLVCHTQDNTTAGSVTDPFYLRLVSDQHLRTSIVFGRNDRNGRNDPNGRNDAKAAMPAANGPFPTTAGQPALASLTAANVDDLVAYLASLRGSGLSMNESKDSAP